MYCTNYTIQKGDTLYSISRKFNVRLDAIITANPLVNVYNLMIGETICIPVSIPSNRYTNTMTYQVKEGDTLGSILHKYGVNLADLMLKNSLDQMYLAAGTTLQIPVSDEEEDGL
jgi:LysM repeat protein